MKDARYKRLILVVVLTCASGGAALGQAGEVRLGPRYIDPIRGFSLRPPLGTVREKGLDATVKWSMRDPQTGAIAWTLVIRRATISDEKTDLKPYAKALAETLKKQEGFEIDSTEIAPVAGKAAIHLAGTSGSHIRWWQRQVWIYNQPQQFLVVRITGPAGMKKRIDTVLEAVLGTIELTDPTEAKELRKANLQRGETFLKKLADKRVAEVVAAGGQKKWFLFRMKGKDAGFMVRHDAPTHHERTRGYETTMWVRMQLPGDQLRRSKRWMFVSADRKIERWGEVLLVGSQPGVAWMTEEGLKQEDLILSNVNRQGKQDTRKNKVPEQIYLPRVLQVLLPGLIDLKTPGGYAFATYTTEGNRFAMHTFTVVGPDRITLADRRIEGIRVTVQTDVTSEPSTLWLDAKGRLLRMSSPEGLTMEPATQAAVLRRFTDAEETVKELDGWPGDG